MNKNMQFGNTIYREHRFDILRILCYTKLKRCENGRQRQAKRNL